MDRINYPTQESVIVGNHDSNYPLYQTNTEVGIFGVLVRLVAYCILRGKTFVVRIKIKINRKTFVVAASLNVTAFWKTVPNRTITEIHSIA